MIESKKSKSEFEMNGTIARTASFWFSIIVLVGWQISTIVYLVTFINLFQQCVPVKILTVFSFLQATILSLSTIWIVKKFVVELNSNCTFIMMLFLFSLGATVSFFVSYFYNLFSCFENLSIPLFALAFILNNILILIVLSFGIRYTRTMKKRNMDTSDDVVENVVEHVQIPPAQQSTFTTVQAQPMPVYRPIQERYSWNNSYYYTPPTDTTFMTNIYQNPRNSYSNYVTNS